MSKVYAGARNPRTGEQIFPGGPAAANSGWGSYLVNPAEPVRVGILRSLMFADPAWDPRSFDWDRDVAFVDATLPFLSATSPDLRAFKAQWRQAGHVHRTGRSGRAAAGHRVLLRSRQQAMGGSAETQTFFRFFPVPGMGHCSGGPGPTTFDALRRSGSGGSNTAGRPIASSASHATDGNIDATRPLCAVPAREPLPGTWQRERRGQLRLWSHAARGR